MRRPTQMRDSRLAVNLGSFMVVMLLLTGVAGAGPVQMWARVYPTGNPLYAGVPNTVEFMLSTDSISVSAATFALAWTFSDGNAIGPLTEGVNVLWPYVVYPPYDSLYWEAAHGLSATNPDTTMFTVFKTGGTNAQLWSRTPALRFTPIGTDTVNLAPLSDMQVLDATGAPAPFEWLPTTFEILPCPVTVPGDVTGDGVVTAADPISLVCYVYKVCSLSVAEQLHADVNCSGTITSADIIAMVNHIFRSGPALCNPCNSH